MGHATLSALRSQLIALAAVMCLRALAGGAFELSGRRGAAAIMSELRGRLVRQLLLASPERRPANARTGELANTAVQGVDALEAYFAGYLPQLVLAAIVPLAAIAWVSALDPIAAGILAVTVPLLVGVHGARGQGRERPGARALAGAGAAGRALPGRRAGARDAARVRARAGAGAHARRRGRALSRGDDGDAARRVHLGARARAVRDDRHRARRGDDRRAARRRRAGAAGGADGAAARARAVRAAAHGRPAVPREHRREQRLRAAVRRARGARGDRAARRPAGGARPGARADPLRARGLSSTRSGPAWC